MLYVRYVHLTKDQAYKVFTGVKPIFSSERMSHNNYDCKDWVEKKDLVMSLKGIGVKTNWLAVNRQS
jgi:hypothetical protein